MKINNTIFTDLVCFSHLRWNFVFQRPQHLLSRFAKHFRVFYIEEPISTSEDDKLMIRKSDENVWVVIPHLNEVWTEEERIIKQKKLLADFFNLVKLHDYVFWYYTPLALSFSDHFNPKMIVYDCMDELSAFKNASPLLKEKEKELMNSADLVFTGGYSLFEAKKHLHKYVFPFPSSIDKEHFGRARSISKDPADQQNIPHPRIGFFGVIDERMDIELVEEIAKRRTDWQFVMIGPVVKINPALLPRLENIHYLGGKSYSDLPLYLSGWDVAMIPFARNESTRFISPTKTPEYLAAGKPVVSTSIRDVVDPYEKKGLVYIADTPGEFISAIEKAIDIKENTNWLHNVDSFLADNSWDETWRYMMSLMMNKLHSKNSETIITKKEKIYV